MVSYLRQDEKDLALHTFGVGRGVDKQELLRIVCPSDPDKAGGHYLPLMVLRDPLW